MFFAVGAVIVVSSESLPEAGPSTALSSAQTQRSSAFDKQRGLRGTQTTTATISHYILTISSQRTNSPFRIQIFHLPPLLLTGQGSSRLRVLFEAALKGYKQQTGIDLAEHPLAERLQYYNSLPVEAVTAILREQAQGCKGILGKR